MGDLPLAVGEFVYTRLSGGATGAVVGGRVYPDEAPAGTACPFVVFTVDEALDVMVVGGEIVYGRVPVTVRATTEGRSYSPLGPIAFAVFADLHGARNVPVAGGGIILASYRTSGIMYPERAAGVDYRHLGGTYLIEAQ